MPAYVKIKSSRSVGSTWPARRAFERRGDSFWSQKDPGSELSAIPHQLGDFEQVI